MLALEIYAELLLNIRQMTVFVALSSNYNETTKLQLSSDRTSFSITHNGEYAETKLPCKIAENGYLKLPQTPVKEFSFRLPLDRDQNTLLETGTIGEDDCPWPASSMTAETQIACRSCFAILSGGSVKAWKIGQR